MQKAITVSSLMNIRHLVVINKQTALKRCFGSNKRRLFKLISRTSNEKVKLLDPSRLDLNPGPP